MNTLSHYKTILNIKTKFGYYEPLKNKFLQVAMVLSLGVALSVPLSAAPTIKSILEKIDQSQNLASDVTARMSFTQVRPVQGTNKYEMEYYRRDKDDSFLLIMLQPSTESGNGYLKTGDDLWLYKKNTRTFQHINRDESISGTDVKSGDLESRKYVEMYAGATNGSGQELIEETTLGGKKVYKFTIDAIVKDVTYPRQTMWVEISSSLVLMVKNYSRSGSLMLSQYFKDYKQVKNSFIPGFGISVDEFDKGNLTIFQIVSIDTSPIKESIFTKAYLENISK